MDGSTPDDAIIGGQTLSAIISANDGDMDGNGYADSSIDYHDTPTDNQDGVKKCIRGKRACIVFKKKKPIFCQ